VLGEPIGIADPRQHQKLRRIDDAAAQQHLALGPGRPRFAAQDMLDPDRAARVEHDAVDARAGLDGEVGAAQRRPQIGLGGAAAPAVADRLLHPPKPFLLGAVVVGRLRHLQRRAGREAGLDQRVRKGRGPHGERPVAAAIVAGAGLPCFLPAEIGQHLGMGPALAPRRGPPVVIAPVAANIGHRVDRRRAADHLAAGALDAPPVESRLRLGEVHPVVQPLFEDAAPADRDLDPRVAVPAAGLQQQHPGLGILGQPPRQGAAGGAGADDDVVVRCRWHRLVPPCAIVAFAQAGV
jgi:hypothetical protein